MRKRLKLIALGFIIISFAVIPLGIMPIAWMARHYIPRGYFAHYPGMSFEFVGGNCMGVYIDNPTAASIILRFGANEKLAANVTPKDVVDAGFKSWRVGSYSNGPSHMCANVDFTAAGLPNYISFPSDRSVSISFRSSKNGQLMTLPVSYTTLVNEFGEPAAKENIYPRKNDFR